MRTQTASYDEAIIAALEAAIPSVRRFGRFMTGSLAVADMLIQECLPIAARIIAEDCNGADASTAVFEAFMKVYRGNKLKMVPTQAQAHGEALCQQGASPPHPSQEIEEALMTLPAQPRALLLLALTEGFSRKQLAKVLGIPLTSVADRLFRARLELGALAGRGYDKGANGL
ncbi:MAG TPA: sigma factor-like helix-turn-helix DNA-binding protein [Hyphomicrobiales bacterium]|nr:sigma factor-like helix-turn-helix DNA-binding protein [Hyphomicrobiales bacterium]